MAEMAVAAGCIIILTGTQTAHTRLRILSHEEAL